MSIVIQARFKMSTSRRTSVIAAVVAVFFIAVTNAQHSGDGEDAAGECRCALPSGGMTYCCGTCTKMVCCTDPTKQLNFDKCNQKKEEHATDVTKGNAYAGLGNSVLMLLLALVGVCVLFALAVSWQKLATLIFKYILKTEDKKDSLERVTTDQPPSYVDHALYDKVERNVATNSVEIYVLPFDNTLPPAYEDVAQIAELQT